MNNETFSHKVGDELELSIEKLTPNGGRGLARHEGFVFFVPFSVPGDVVKARITKLKKSFAEASVVDIIKSSEDRVDPECDYFGRCGGCSLQMVSTEYQEKIKQSFIKEMTHRLGLDSEKILKPLVGSPKDFRYRNRVQLHQKGKDLGYYKKESHTLVSVEDCLIADTRLTDKFEELRKENKRRRFELALTENEEVIVRDEKQKSFKNLFFSQVNEGVNRKLKEHLQTVVSGLSLKGDHALDLYAGSGNLSEILQKYFKNVTAVEMSRSSVKNGQSKLKDVNFKCQSVDKFLKENTKDYDLVVMDPPRHGLDKASIEGLISLNPENIIYISCNPATLERDLRLLQGLFQVEHIKAFDMFPQTSHIETFVHIKRS